MSNPWTSSWHYRSLFGYVLVHRTFAGPNIPQKSKNGAKGWERQYSGVYSRMGNPKHAKVLYRKKLSKQTKNDSRFVCLYELE